MEGGGLCGLWESVVLIECTVPETCSLSLTAQRVRVGLPIPRKRSVERWVERLSASQAEAKLPCEPKPRGETPNRHSSKTDETRNSLSLSTALFSTSSQPCSGNHQPYFNCACSSHTELLGPGPLVLPSPIICAPTTQVVYLSPPPRHDRGTT